MSGFSYATNVDLVRTNLWSNQLKEQLLPEMMAQKYVDWSIAFPDGDTINIPSIGQMEVRDFAEGQQAQYTAMDTGNFTFSITEYKQSGTYITDKYKQDSFYSSQLIAKFVPAQHRALMADIETKVLAVGNDSQTASSLNAINGGDHRFVGSGIGPGGTLAVIAPKDFARAKYALRKAFVPLNNLVCIVDPSVEYTLSTLTNLTNVSFNPKWEGIIRDGMSTTGMRFSMSIFGWDVYVSDFLKSGITETIDGRTCTSGMANVFFSADSTVTPWIGSIRQPPRVESKRNQDFQRDEYLTTMRYGVKTFRPENQVIVLTAADVS